MDAVTAASLADAAAIEDSISLGRIGYATESPGEGLSASRQVWQIPIKKSEAGKLVKMLED